MSFKRNAQYLVATAALASSMCMTSIPARANDVVAEWNQIALAATIAAGEGPNPQARSMAIVHVSMHDSVNAITGDYDTYLPIETPRGSPEAAAIASAHHVLTRLFPAQATTLNTARAASLAARGLSEADPGIAFGEAVAAGVLSRRSNDGAAGAQFAYTAPNAGRPGVWVAVGAAAPVLPNWGQVTPWVLQSGAQFRPDGPPAIDSGRYARDYNEVREVGSLTSLTRTPEQTNIASFWRASPSVIWNTVARQVVEAQGLDLPARARVFALMYLATSDAGIACWDAKYTFNRWRPITAIRNGDADGNDDTPGDPGWQPLFPTPQHPEYVSGHATNSSAMATALSLLFGDAPGLLMVATSPANAGFERRWMAFSEGIDEVIDARVYSGVHYRTSDTVGARLGAQVARFVVDHALRPQKTND